MLRGMASRRLERAGAALMPVAAMRRVKMVVECMMMGVGLASDEEVPGSRFDLVKSTSCRVG